MLSQNGMYNNALQLEDARSKPVEDVFHTSSTITYLDGSVAGTGLPANITMDCNNSGGPISKTSISNLVLSVPVPWTIIYTNITIKDVLQQSTIILVEDSITANFLDTASSYYAMQFNMNNRALLRNCSVYVHDVKKVTAITVRVYNATLQGADPAPDAIIYSQAFGGLGDTEDNRWHDFVFSSSVEINPTNTYGNAFFIALNPTVGSGGNFQWGYELDTGGNDGAAYSPGWTLQA